MRIGINASALVHENTGVARYTSSFLKALSAREEARDTVLFYNYFRRWGGETGGVLPDLGMENKTWRIPERLLRLSWNLFNRPSVERLIGRVDIYHNLSFYGIPQQIGKQISTVHDLLFMRFPDSFTASVRDSLTGAVVDAVKRADYIITVSNAAKSDIIEMLGVPENRIRVIYEAPDQAFKPVDDTDILKSIRKKYGIDKDYLLFLGAGEPRKNLPFLMEAYGSLSQDIRQEYRLVIAGPARWGSEAIDAKIKECGIERDVILTGYIPDKEAAALYSGATAFIFPSLGEGFGLPVLEAMSCGAPVICSGISSMPEVAGDAAYKIDPHNVEDLTAAIQALVTDESLRAGFRRKGFDRAAEFSWEKNVTETLAVYHELVEGTAG